MAVRERLLHCVRNDEMEEIAASALPPHNDNVPRDDDWLAMTGKIAMTN